MTVEVERDALLAALKQVAQVVESRNTIPIIGNLLIVAEGGTLTVTGTDLDQRATAQVPAAGDIGTTVAKDKLVAAVDSLKPGKLTIAPVEGRAAVTIKQGRAVRTLPTLPRDDFPVIKDPEAVTRFTIAAAVLARLLDTTIIAVSNEETRYYLNGVFMHVTDGRLRAVSTDGHRLIRAEAAAPEGAADMADVILPTKAINQLRALLAKSEAEVVVALASDRASFSVGPFQLLTKVIDGTFPDYTRVIPPEVERKIMLAREQLIDPPTAVAAVINAEGDKIKFRGVAFDLTVEDGPQVQAQDTMGNQASEPIDLTFTGEAIRFGVNQRYLTQAAAIFAPEATITMQLADARAPIRLTSDKDADLLAVVMPMNA